jgi:hypothetical protein
VVVVSAEPEASRAPSRLKRSAVTGPATAEGFPKITGQIVVGPQAGLVCPGGGGGEPAASTTYSWLQSSNTRDMQQ